VGVTSKGEGVQVVQRRRSRFRALAVLAVAAVGLPACGGDERDEPSSAPTSSDPSSTSPTTSPSSSTTTSGVVGEVAIPTDPATLVSCDELASNTILTTPSRWWTDPPEGWRVAYAFGGSSPASDATPYVASTMVRVDGADTVGAAVTVSGQEGPGGFGNAQTAEATIRGVPARLGPQATRAGPTGNVQAGWKESGLDMSAVGHGLSEAELSAVLDASQLDGGVVVAAPSGWTVLGAGRSIGGFESTVIGLVPEGGDLDSSGVAPVELAITDRADGTPGSGALQVPDGDLRLASVAGRPALVGQLGDASNVLSATTQEGHAVRAAGTGPPATLLTAAGGLRRVDADDPVLVGVPMGNGNSSGAWCRQDR
jgi:hypothetical protein